ncbi:unnamed protein product [Gongylonema pulchrum]|uniref:Tektin n=1 Tax=Gongylonema pulchrum TaxID=637853 RepID=A0A183DV51_9BILA|nr:unnamed protein product [Gongylonema pulchrum]
MLNCIRKLLGIRKKYEIDEQDTEITKLYNAVVVARNELAHAKKRWRENQAHITCLRKTIHDLAKELKETKRLLSREKKYSDSSVSLDTDIIIDAQNELQAVNEQIRFFRSVLCMLNTANQVNFRWRENQAHITCLRKTIHDLAKELKETKRLLSRENKYSDSSVSLDTDIIIDAQNELQAVNEQIRFFRSVLCMYERDTRELRAHYASTNLRMQHSERCKAHLQTACAQAQNIAVQTFQQFQQNRGMNDADNEPENAAA